MTSPKAELTGDIDATSLWAGQSVGLVRDIRPAAELVRQLADEAADALRTSLAQVRS